MSKRDISGKERKVANLNELDKLEYYLKGAKIPFNRIDEDNRYVWEHGYTIGHDAMDKLDIPKGWGERHQIVAYKEDGVDVDWDVICHYGSYGYEEGLLELMGSLLVGHNDVEGYLTADDIIERIEKRGNTQ